MFVESNLVNAADGVKVAWFAVSERNRGRLLWVLGFPRQFHLCMLTTAGGVHLTMVGRNWGSALLARGPIPPKYFRQKKRPLRRWDLYPREADPCAAQGAEGGSGAEFEASEALGVFEIQRAEVDAFDGGSRQVIACVHQDGVVSGGFASFGAGPAEVVGGHQAVHEEHHGRDVFAF